MCKNEASIAADYSDVIPVIVVVVVAIYLEYSWSVCKVCYILLTLRFDSHEHTAFASYVKRGRYICHHLWSTAADEASCVRNMANKCFCTCTLNWNNAKDVAFMSCYTVLNLNVFDKVVNGFTLNAPMSSNVIFYLYLSFVVDILGRLAFSRLTYMISANASTHAQLNFCICTVSIWHYQLSAVLLLLLFVSTCVDPFEVSVISSFASHGRMRLLVNCNNMGTCYVTTVKSFLHLYCY